MRLLWVCVAGAALAAPLPKDDGYRGIWYYNQPSGDEYVYKYSGGLGTYPHQQLPIAYYSKVANKTFFCWGGSVTGKNELLHMVSYYDHATGLVPRPRILLNKRTDDAHDNPVLTLDGDGYVWVFSNAHGTARPAYVHRSTRPYSVDEFERVLETNYSYAQPWHFAGLGFLLMHTRYQDKGRSLYWMTSPDGRTWEEPRLLARVSLGHYQISGRHGARVGTVFNYHPAPVGLNARTNLYYVETADMGRTWRAADGRAVAPPLREVRNPALVRDYESEKLLVYLKDLQFDAQGRPVILYMTSRGYASGPTSDPHTWHTARWTGERWELRPITTSDHNYDCGALYIEPGGVWRMIAPTDPGPQPHTTGGEMVTWLGRDEGRTWVRLRPLTRNSRYNHTYARRPVNAHPDFYALWADGDTLKPSESSLYFCNRDGARVRRLPPAMTGELARPEPLQ